MSAVQIGRYRGGSGTATVTGTGFDEVANVAGLSAPAIAPQLRRVRSNQLIYRTLNGTTWLPVSMQVDVADNAALATLTEMIHGQHILVRADGWLWRWDAVFGLMVVDDRAVAVPAAIVPIPGWSEPVNMTVQDRDFDAAGTFQEIQRVLATLIHDLRVGGYLA